ncbi:MAG: hypothetical protein M0D55_14065 [Elusimicrobiota bacterium]|nr:MAG: hypothetical protein M0D55_14065 [Elusimicrobiota bacterium]
MALCRRRGGARGRDGTLGAARLRALDAAPRPSGGFTIACAQHDLPFPWEWRASHGTELFRAYESMALEASAKGADLILFPQYQLPEDVYREPGRWGTWRAGPRRSWRSGPTPP